MKEKIYIEPFKGSDTQELIALWNRCLPIDGTNLDIFERKVLLDPNFDPAGLLLAKTKKEGRIIGFILCIVSRVPLEEFGMQLDRGWITAIGVEKEYRRQGIGSALWHAGEQFFRNNNRKAVFIATYPPNYFVPGIDEKEYPEAISFFQHHGFTIVSRPISMEAYLIPYKVPNEIKEKEEKLLAQGIRIQIYERKYLLQYLDFMRKYMPADWLRTARKNLTLLTQGLFKPEQIIIAIDENKNEIVGYCQYEGEHLGPFGVRDDYQGRGIGSVILAKTVVTMRNAGFHNAWLLWTDDKAGRVYAKVGFKESRRYAVLKKELI